MYIYIHLFISNIFISGHHAQKIKEQDQKAKYGAKYFLP